MRLLVTGFGPFPGIPRNPSAEAARRVVASPRWRLRADEVDALVLPTTYAALDTLYQPVLDGSDLDAILMIGVAGRSKRIRVERRAVNRLSLLKPDAAHRKPTHLAALQSPPTRASRAKPDVLAVILRGRGLPARVSQDAGRYLCNASYFRTLALPVPVVFIHIPRPPRTTRRVAARRAKRTGWHDDLAAALTEIGIHLLRQSRGS